MVAPYSDEKKKKKKDAFVLSMDSCSLWSHDANSFWEKKMCTYQTCQNGCMVVYQESWYLVKKQKIKTIVQLYL